MDFENAENKFEDNHQLAVVADRTEKRNLYSGLADLARGLDRLEGKLATLEKKIARRSKSR